MTAAIEVSGLHKTYVLHVQGGTRIPVLRDVNFIGERGACVTLHGPSGAGKSTLLRCLYGNCKANAGSIRLRHGETEIDMVTADPRGILDVRRGTMGYVSQFLRVIPRVPAIDVVAEPLRALGQSAQEARSRAAALLERLRIPPALWSLAPATFSGGEQQRVNIARGFASPRPILLLDEPTASLDAENRAVVVELIMEAKRAGSTIIGVFHDQEVRDAVSTHIVTLKAEAVQ